MPPPKTDFLTNLEWMALGNNGQIRQLITTLRQENARLQEERNVLLADNTRLRNELAAATKFTAPSQAPAPQVAETKTEPVAEEPDDAAAVRSKLLELY